MTLVKENLRCHNKRQNKSNDEKAGAIEKNTLSPNDFFGPALYRTIHVCFLTDKILILLYVLCYVSYILYKIHATYRFFEERVFFIEMSNFNVVIIGQLRGN